MLSPLTAPVFHDLVDDFQTNIAALSGTSTAGEIVKSMASLADVFVNRDETISDMIRYIETVNHFSQPRRSPVRRFQSLYLTFYLPV